MILQIPTALAPNYETLIAMRFFAGLVCSPALSTGGATLADVFSPLSQPYVVALWAAGAVAGPVTGPVAGGYAAQEENWRWPLYMLLFLSVFSFIVLSFSFAETSADNILLRRAQRLRKLTGNENLRSQSEIDQAEISLTKNVGQSLSRPFLLMTEPMVLFIDIYIAVSSRFKAECSWLILGCSWSTPSSTSGLKHSQSSSRKFKDSDSELRDSHLSDLSWHFFQQFWDILLIKSTTSFQPSSGMGISFPKVGFW